MQIKTVLNTRMEIADTGNHHILCFDIFYLQMASSLIPISLQNTLYSKKKKKEKKKEELIMIYVLPANVQQLVHKPLHNYAPDKGVLLLIGGISINTSCILYIFF